MTGPAVLSSPPFKTIFYMHIAFHRPIGPLNTILQSDSDVNDFNEPA
jgi:hypothetical protein